MIDYALDIERAVLGNCLIDENALEDLKLPEEAFYSFEHREIYKALKEAGADVIAVEQNLREKGLLDRIHSELNDCVVDASTNYDYHHQILKEKYLQRFMREGLRQALKKTDNVHSLIDDVQRLADTMQTDRIALTPDEIFDREESTPRAEKIMFAERQLDEFYKDASNKGMLEVTIADSGHGKTQFAMYKVDKILKQGYKVLWIQLEGVDVDTAKYFQDNPYKNNIYITHSLYDIEDIKSEARTLNRRVGIDYIVIDYVQNVECARMDRANGVEYISQQLTRLAKDLDCYVHLLSQVSINYNARSGWKQEPSYGDVRWSQQLKQDAHIISSVFRPSRIEALIEDNHIRDFDNNLAPYDSVYVKHAKVRHGKQEWKRIHYIHTENGLIPLAFMKDVPF
jgi:replicative DNA helicase